MNTKKIAFLGVSTALVFAATQIRIPIVVGYLNLGDAIILISTYILGPLAAISGAIGSALADLIAGYPIYIAPTFIIKGLVALISYGVIRLFRSKKPNIPMRLAAFVLAELWMALGYLGFESLPFIYGFKTAVVSLPFNLLQALASVIIAIIITSIPAVKFERFKK